MRSVLSPAIEAQSAGSSMIRKMFEAGIEMKRKFGDENVYDFSLGNPDVPPPPQVKTP
ncbi:MAG: pyridoxal phosphate-dependent aminotransferase, partial [Kiritimatiellaeota bacterium]|nr:pyridoxal phosphate-dependent aminotransferase [Kiritimatiellota bacterium]